MSSSLSPCFGVKTSWKRPKSLGCLGWTRVLVLQPFWSKRCYSSKGSKSNCWQFSNSQFLLVRPAIALLVLRMHLQVATKVVVMNLLITEWDILVIKRCLYLLRELSLVMVFSKRKDNNDGDVSQEKTINDGLF